MRWNPNCKSNYDVEEERVKGRQTSKRKYARKQLTENPEKVREDGARWKAASKAQKMAEDAERTRAEEALKKAKSRGNKMAEDAERTRADSTNFYCQINTLG